MSKSLVKIISLITVLVFTFSLPCSFAAAEITGPLPSTPFKDVPLSHWGARDIIKMNLRHVVAGYSNGNFYPAKPVSQAEALLMAVFNMESSELAAVNANQTLPVIVPGWVEKNFKKEVLFAIQKGLIIPSDNDFSASANASRAWVARLMVRMINKNGEASQLANLSPSFTDAGSIPDWALGYVNAALKYKLMAGYPDSTFKPNRDVTRAEMVALMSRSEQYLSLANTVITAKIISLAGQNLSVSVNGNPKNINVNSATWFFDDKGKNITQASIKENDAIKIVLDGTTAKYIEILPAETVLNTIKGTVLQVLPGEKVIVIKDDKQKIHTMTLSGFATLSAQTGEINSLSQIAAGNQVELGLNTRGDAATVLLLNNSGSISNTGIVFSINQEQKLLIIKNPSGKFDSYQYSDQVTVKVPNQRFPGIKDIQPGDEVKIKVEAGAVTEIELVKASQQLILTGKVVLISPEKRILTVQKDDNSLEAFAIADNVEIKISGLNYPLLTNVLVNDRVELNIDQGKIITVTVIGRSVENTLKGTVAAVDTINRILTLKTEKDELKAYEVSTRAEFSINDQNSTSLSDIKKDMKVEIQLVDNKIIYLATKNTIEGSLVSLDQSRRLMTVKISNVDKTYIISSNVDVDIEGDSSPDLNDINKNDFLEMRVEDNVVTKINVERTYSYQVINIYKSSNELKVKKDDSEKYLYLSNRVTLIVPGAASPDIDDFAVGNVVKATFLGNKLVKVEALPVTRGQITSVNVFSGTVTVQTFEGTTTTYTFNNKSEAVNGSQKNYQINALATGDRVEAREKADGGISFSIMKKITGKYQALTDDGNKIYIARDPITWSNYTLSSKIYIHSRNQQLTVRNLTKDEQIELYILDDIVYEIEKK